METNEAGLSSDLVDKDGNTAGEWVGWIVFEARRDAEGLWRIVKAGREKFILAGADLEGFVRMMIVELLRAGAAPVYASLNSDNKQVWKRFNLVGCPETIATSVVGEWRKSGRDPQFEHLWFSFAYE